MSNPKITDLQPQKKNANLHKEHGERLLRKSIENYGIGDGITVAANDEAISGSLRIETLADMMPDVKIQIVETWGETLLVNKRMDIPTPETKAGRALSVASNSVAVTDWNPDWNLLKEWAGEDEQIKKMFSDDEWKEGTGGKKPMVDTEPQIGRAAELQEKWQTATGQLWKLGNHRLLIGDCTVRENVERLMGGEKIDCVFTSPPYNQGNEWGELLTGVKGNHEMYPSSENKDDMTEDEYKDFIFSVLDIISFFVSELHSIVWNCAYNAKSRNLYGKIIFSESNPFEVFESIVWNKGGSINLPHVGIYSRQCEFVFVMSKGEKYLTSQEYGKPRWNYWETKRQNQLKEHKATFPIEFAERGISEFSLENNVIFEPFAGSGTTIIAAHNLNRRCFAMEISEKYGAVILERFYTATGKTPELVK